MSEVGGNDRSLAVPTPSPTLESTDAVEIDSLNRMLSTACMDCGVRITIMNERNYESLYVAGSIRPR